MASNAPSNPILFILQHREMIRSAIESDIHKRYAGSILGRGWLILSPILLLGVYTVVYVFIFRLRPAGMELHEYVLHIFSGLVTYLGLAEGISAGMAAVMSNKSVLRGTAFPAALIPVKAVVGSQVGFLIGMILLVVASLAFGGLTWRVVLLPFTMLLQIAFLIGLAWFLSLLNVVVRDLQHAVSYVLMVLMVLSPIAYTMDMVPNVIRAAVLLNPVAHFIFMSQAVMGGASSSYLGAFVVCIILTAVTVFFGFGFFQKTKAIITEYA